jgi:5-methylcytosine-specific restriction endonuclease McrA
MTKLRLACWERDQGICQVCGVSTFWEARFDGDPQAYHMAHIRNKRNYGDTLDNVQCLCARDHMREHAGRIKR